MPLIIIYYKSYESGPVRGHRSVGFTYGYSKGWPLNGPYCDKKQGGKAVAAAAALQALRAPGSVVV